MKIGENNISLTICSCLNLIASVSALINEILQLAGFDAETAGNVDLAVREAVANAIKHGNKEDPTKWFEVKLHFNDSVFDMEVADQGKGFDPTQLPDCCAAGGLLNFSGRGVFLMRALMDAVEFSVRPEGGTVVRMSKRQGQPQ
jgi:serine/threonine-protein kinase RsbW